MDCESILGKINRSALFLSLGFLCRFSCMLLENRSSMRLLIKVFEVAQYLMVFFMTDPTSVTNCSLTTFEQTRGYPRLK